MNVRNRATGGVTAPPNLIDIKDRLKWHGREMQLVLFDLGPDSWRRQMNTHPKRAKVGIAQARVIAYNLCDKLYSADSLAYQHGNAKLGHKVPLTGELMFDVEELIRHYRPEGRSYSEADIDIDLCTAHRVIREYEEHNKAIEERNKAQGRFDFGRKQKRAKKAS